MPIVGVMVRVLPRILAILGLLWAPPASALCEMHCLTAPPDAFAPIDGTAPGVEHSHHDDSPTEPPAPRDSIHAVHHEASPDPDSPPHGTIHPAHHEATTTDGNSSQQGAIRPSHHDGTTDRNPPPQDPTRSAHHEASPADSGPKGKGHHEGLTAQADPHQGATHCSKSSGKDLDPAQAHERDCTCTVELTSGAPGTHRVDALAPLAITVSPPPAWMMNYVVSIRVEPPQPPQARSPFAERRRPLLV